MMEVTQTPWELRHHRFGLAGEGQADLIETYLAARPGMLLNVGCGFHGHHVDNLARLCKWQFAVDREPKMVSRSATNHRADNVSYAVADGYNLPFRGPRFDCVIALGLLAYITEIGKLLTEFRRVITSAGIIVLTDSVSRSKESVFEAAKKSALKLLEDAENSCPAASGGIKRRRLFVFEAV
jgi:ubiquinone/menaquinone biosynthesis C-methylase UbiE